MSSSMYKLEMYDVGNSWDMIGLGSELPPDRDRLATIQAVLDIWLAALFREIKGHPTVIQHAFFRSLEGDPVEAHGREVTFDVFRDIALEAGVDFQIEAYLAGTPLEYILAE